MTQSQKSPVALLLIAATGLCATTADAGIRRHDRADALYLDLAMQPQFDSTARLSINGPNGARTCSGTLLNSQWILTAAHCFDGVDNLNAAALVGGQFGFADEIIIHPGWTPGGFTLGADLALIHLSTPITSVTAASLYSGSNELGALGFGVGFGAAGTGSSGEIPNSFGTKRAGTNDIDALGTERGFHESILLTDFDHPLVPSLSTFGSATPTDLEYQVAGGDSGGSLFIMENGQYHLAGVTSFINASDGDPDGDYGDMSAYTRVSDYYGWINSVIPAPSGLIVLSAGILSGTRRRR